MAEFQLQLAAVSDRLLQVGDALQRLVHSSSELKPALTLVSIIRSLRSRMC